MKVKKQIDHTSFLTIFVASAISVMLLFSTFWFNILNNWLVGSIEDIITNALDSDAIIDASIMNDIRDSIFTSQSRVLIFLLVLMMLFVIIVAFIVRKFNNYRFNPMKIGFYNQYIDDCIKIVDDVEDSGKGLWTNFVDLLLGT